MYTLATSEKECIFFHIAIAGHPASPVAKCLGAGRGALAEQLAEPRPWWPCRDGQLPAKIRNGGGMPGARDQRHIKLNAYLQFLLQERIQRCMRRLFEIIFFLLYNNYN